MKLNHNSRLSKKKVVSILVLLLFLIISISAVSANTDAINNDTISATFQNNLDSVSQSGTENNTTLSTISWDNSDSVSQSISENEKADNSKVIKKSQVVSNPKGDSSNDTKVYIYLTSDKIINSSEDIAFMEAIKTEIGDRATVIIDPNAPNPNEVNRVIKSAEKGIAAYISNFCSGTTYGLVQYDMRGYLKNYSSKLDGVCFIYYGTIPVNSTDFIARAWDDNFSNEYFAGLYYPYKYISEGGLGFIQARANGDNKNQMIKTIAEGLLSYAKNSNSNHLSTENITSILKYVAKHDFSPVELAKDANKLLNGKSTKLSIQNWIYYTAQYVGAIPIKNTTKKLSLPTNFSSSTFKSPFTLSRVDYRTLALKIANFMTKYGIAPTYVTYNGKKININDYTYMLAKIVSGHTNKSKFIFTSSFKVVKSPLNMLSKKSSVKSSSSSISKKFSVKNILTASVNLKKYIIKYRKLPSTVTVGGVKLSMSEYLYLSSKTTVNINKKVLSAITFKKFSKNVKSTKNRVSGKLKKATYLNLAKTIIKYMDKNKIAPRTMRNSLGTIQFRTMVYNYASILSFYKSNKYLPKYVTLNDKKRFK